MTNGVPVEYEQDGQVTKDDGAPVVHCIVHPGFDAWDQPDFEAYLHSYIEHIASRTQDVILLVSDGESFDEEQVRQFTLIRMIEGISMFLSVHDGGLGDIMQMLRQEDGASEDAYFQALESNGLSRSLYEWCEQNVDLAEFSKVAEWWREHKRVRHSADMREEEKWQWLDTEAARLREWEKEVKMSMDIASLAWKAFDELGVVEWEQMRTCRNLKNRPRFIRLYQHAMEALGRERVREIFIADEERSDNVSITPVTHFRNEDRTLSPTPVADEHPQQVFHASEEACYGNAAELRDKLTYALSLSRHRKLIKNQPLDALQAMNFPLTPETRFVFSGEYRGRCVSNVANIVRDRLREIWWEYFFADDRLTLLRSDDAEKEHTEAS
jgi:hypothetical protein